MPEIALLEAQIPATGRWGRFRHYPAKVGTHGSTLVLVKGNKGLFKLNQKIHFCELHTLRGMSTGCTPPWQTGHIWLLYPDRIFINR